MRIVLAIFATVIAVGAFNTGSVSTARADQYKWCAIYGGGDDGGGTNCYFVTLEQCRAAVSGVGGICMPSPFNGNNPATSFGPDSNTPAPRKKKS